MIFVENYFIKNEITIIFNDMIWIFTWHHFLNSPSRDLLTFFSLNCQSSKIFLKMLEKKSDNEAERLKAEANATYSNGDYLEALKLYNKVNFKSIKKISIKNLNFRFKRQFAMLKVKRSYHWSMAIVVPFILRWIATRSASKTLI